jgi:hypothetical protein
MTCQNETMMEKGQMMQEKIHSPLMKDSLPQIHHIINPIAFVLPANVETVPVPHDTINENRTTTATTASICI